MTHTFMQLSNHNISYNIDEKNVLVIEGTNLKHHNILYFTDETGLHKNIPHEIVVYIAFVIGQTKSRLVVKKNEHAYTLYSNENYEIEYNDHPILWTNGFSLLP